MENAGTEKEKFDKLEDSGYSTRTMYLNSMKEFMADTTGICDTDRDDDIEEYFRYEKEISHRIQEILKQCQ